MQIIFNQSFIILCIMQIIPKIIVANKMFVSIIIYLFVMVQTSGNILCYYNNYLLLKITE
ncbi:MAG: hypothetical protein EL88_08290 [Phocaeicola dorei]|uniref:Uncharacterized protein n=1 Tax=Phocaeicola vulgatus TaxID=821 RepID=A0A3E5FDG5_PHOVU|nr:MAG: hypothetical protein EL88_08290 [Phocaeicola dorei]RGO02249.1 hypothetical protein DXB34_09835 [Phocaeicola vulgatus]RGV02625.1 hypothetical protein DWW27_23930 [Phocaeicola vulgatus]